MDSYNDSNLNLSQEYCDNLYDSPSKCLSNYPLLTTIVASGTVLTAGYAVCDDDAVYSCAGG
jgi:hypothetical protein